MLRRLGFAVLAMAAPLLAVGSRRALVIVVPLGIAMLVLASVIETEGQQPLRRTLEALGRPAGLAAVFLVFWSGLSLLWTPFPSAALERLLNMAGFGFMGLVAVSALPERMRASNLYLLPLGVGLAAILALSLTIRPMFAAGSQDIDRSLLDRALLLLVLMTPAAVTWLISKDRLVSGFLLIAVVTACLLLGDARAALLALILGAGIFAVATISPRIGRLAAMLAMPALVLAAPVLPFLMRPSAKLMLGASHPRVEAIRTWAKIVTDDPGRLITGHGLDTAMRAKLAGLVPPQTPSGMLFEVWYDLGFLGAFALALILALAIRGTGKLHAGAAPGALMTLMVAFTLAIMGQASAQAWWLIGLALTAIMVIAVDHGQYRTTRPRSQIVPSRARRIPAP